MADADMKAMGWLILGLFAIMLIVAVFYIGQSELNEVICENEATGWTYQNAVCYNGTPGATTTAQTVTAITKVNTVVALADIVLGLLALVIVVKLFKVILRVGKSFSDD